MHQSNHSYGHFRLSFKQFAPNVAGTQAFCCLRYPIQHEFRVHGRNSAEVIIETNEVNPCIIAMTSGELDVGSTQIAEVADWSHASVHVRLRGSPSLAI